MTAHPRQAVSIDPTGGDVTLNHATLGLVKAFEQPDGSWQVIWNGNVIGTVGQQPDGTRIGNFENEFSASYTRVKHAVSWVADQQSGV